jgi:hypothetical protein
MLHMIDDQIEAYRRAVADTAKAHAVFQLNPHSTNNDSLVSCREEEQLRLDGLKSVIRMVLQDYATQNPFTKERQQTYLIIKAQTQAKDE